MLNHNPQNNTNTKLIQQIILLDESFNLVKSNNTIFSIDKLAAIPVEKWFPFIESVHETIKKMKLEDNEIQFLRIESPAEFLPGSYDFSFSKIKINGIHHILWSICDYTEVYTYLSKYQQLKNELDIHRQRLDYQNRQATQLDDLFS